MYGSNIPPPAMVTLKQAFRGAATNGTSAAEPLVKEPPKSSRKRKACTALFNCPNPAVVSSQNGKIFYCTNCKPSGEKVKKLH